MKSTTIGGQRQQLSSQLPLSTPFLVQIFPVYACNFKCSFCIFSQPKEKHGFMSEVPMMDLDVFRKTVEDMKQFPEKIKMLRFAGTGEPLLHKQLPLMVEIAKKAEIAQRIDVVTNGALLTPSLSDDLISAGLDHLRISVNGLHKDAFQENCSAVVDFETYVENIRYYYEHRGNLSVYIKIIDYMVEKEEDRRFFYETFQPISTTIAVEHLVETTDIVDIDRLKSKNSLQTSQNGTDLLDVEVCPQPFYMMQVNPDGKIAPCCSMEYPAILGDVSSAHTVDLWNGEKYNNLRLQLLKNEKNKVCSRCKVYKYGIYPEDVLDQQREYLQQVYS